ncbi:uncharacterized protein LOC117575592 [Drosophila albomicans]|uniref:Uncharacterized protein LOC117575592 n=1 Tax=Drosophila albomicans TaxID=7291 RepID=A0A6P8XRJ6_DROAB|nr:uncharacterized protein LOC117575592 [Drosophila albomicans]
MYIRNFSLYLHAALRRRPRLTFRSRGGQPLIDGYRFVISYQQQHRCYLKCAHFRNKCRARAIQNKVTGQVQLSNGVHNHNRGQDQH